VIARTRHEARKCFAGRDMVHLLRRSRLFPNGIISQLICRECGPPVVCSEVVPAAIRPLPTSVRATVAGSRACRVPSSTSCPCCPPVEVGGDGRAKKPELPGQLRKCEGVATVMISQAGTGSCGTDLRPAA